MAENKESKKIRKELSNLLLSWFAGEDVDMSLYYNLKKAYMSSRIFHYKNQNQNAFYLPLSDIEKTEREQRIKDFACVN